MNRFELFKLKCSKGMSNRGLNKIVAADGKMRKQRYSALEYARMAELRRTRFEFVDSFQSLNLRDVNQQFRAHKMLTIFDERYPDWLKEMTNPPVVLFYQGNIDLLSGNMLAVVGARSASNV
ncbi:MAG: DNA-processing protein DprA, partial [Streptococcaceae bacterium]|nr:DNA-processing protein DprA [Streptococcaceae bacterium]